MSFSGGSILDPYYLAPEVFPKLSNRSLKQKVPVDPRLVSGERTFVVVGVGQSNISNTNEGLYTPTNTQKNQNLNIFNGGVYQSSDPLLGTSSETGCWLGRLADKLINDGTFDRVILVPIGMGATTVAQWAPGGPENAKLSVAVRRCEALGLTIDAFLWQQGENDHGTARAAYTASLQSVIATPRTLGVMAPWFIGKSTYTGGATDNNVRLACQDVLNGTNILAGGDTDSLIGATYRYDGVHLTAEGSNVCADIWKAPIQSHFGA